MIKNAYNKFGILNGKAFPGRAAILIKILGINEKIIKNVFEKPNSKKLDILYLVHVYQLNLIVNLLKILKKLKS